MGHIVINVISHGQPMSWRATITAVSYKVNGHSGVPLYTVTMSQINYNSSFIMSGY